MVNKFLKQIVLEDLHFILGENNFSSNFTKELIKIKTFLKTKLLC
jgi:hypothetical protein